MLPIVKVFAGYIHFAKDPSMANEVRQLFEGALLWTYGTQDAPFRHTMQPFFDAPPTDVPKGMSVLQVRLTKAVSVLEVSMSFLQANAALHASHELQLAIDAGRGAVKVLRDTDESVWYFWKPETCLTVMASA